jgi:hypothetical protein
MGGKTISRIGAGIATSGASELALLARNKTKSGKSSGSGQTTAAMYEKPYFHEERELLLSSLGNYAAKTGWKIDPALIGKLTDGRNVRPNNLGPNNPINQVPSPGTVVPKETNEAGDETSNVTRPAETPQASDGQVEQAPGAQVDRTINLDGAENTMRSSMVKPTEASMQRAMDPVENNVEGMPEGSTATFYNNADDGSSDRKQRLNKFWQHMGSK